MISNKCEGVMKKKCAFLAALLLAVSGVFMINVPVSACLGPDGNPVEGMDGAETNCLSVAEEQQVEYEEYFGVQANSLDFGRVTELDRSYTKQIEVKNNTANDVVLDATVEKNESVPEDNSKLVDWLAFVGGVTHFSASAGQIRSYGVRVFVPADAKAGSQYANVVLTDASGHKETVVIKIDIAGDDLKYASEVNGAWIDPVRLDEKLNGRVSVKNNGTAGFTSTYQVKSKNFFGGDGTTTFKVPDLQGEFLRCTGTNSRTNCGSGDNVGVHQAPTILPRTFAADSEGAVYSGRQSDYHDPDSSNMSMTAGDFARKATSTAVTKTSVMGPPITVRPTNTSVWYCIKF
jgi:microcystin-dependent protein